MSTPYFLTHVKRMENEGDEAKKVARYRRFRELVGPLQRLLYLSYLRRAI